MAFDFRVTALEDKEFEEIVRTFADTTAANARGAAAGTTTNLLEPRLWMREVVDAAQKRFRYGEVSMTKDIPKGHVNLIVPKRRAFISGTSWAANVTPGTAVNFTTLNNFDGVEVNPNWRNYATAISYDVIQQNVVDYVGAAREELVYKAGDHVDQDIVTEISGATLRGRGYSNGSVTNTGTTYTVTASTWYRIEILVTSSSLATFSLYSEQNALLWSSTVATNIPTATGRETGITVLAYRANNVATYLLDVDWVAFYNAALVRS